MAEKQPCLVLKGKLEGHTGWITQLATSPVNPKTLVSSSRGETLFVH